MTVDGEGQWLRPPSGSTGGGFSGAKIRGLNQGGTVITTGGIAAGATFIFGTTGSWAALVTEYDTDGYWVAANRRFEIPTTGYYLLHLSASISFTAGYSGLAGDGGVVFFDGTTQPIQPNWQPDMVGTSRARGSHSEFVHATAGDWFNMSMENISSTHAMLWDSGVFSIQFLGT